MKYLTMPFNDPLNSEDTEFQTKGCRANNPDIYKNCMAEDVCAFCRKDGICKFPSRKWKAQFIFLKDKQ